MMSSRFMKPATVMVIFLMLASAFAVFVPVPVGAEPVEEPVVESRATSRADTENANDDINGADLLTSGVVNSADLLISQGGQDYQDWFRIDCTRGQVIYGDVYLIDWNAADTGQYNLNIVLYGPEEEESNNYVSRWLSFLQERHETATTLCAFSAPYFLRVMINVTGDDPPEIATDPVNYEITITAENPQALNGGANEQATLDQDTANWFKWYKMNTPKDQSFNARLTNPNGANIDMDMFGLWARGYDSDAGYQGYQPFFMNQTRNDATNGNVEQMAGMTGDLDVFVRLWLRSGRTVGQYTFELQNALIPSDNDNVPGDALLIEKTSSKVYHGHQAVDHFDWYKFDIDAGFTVDITFSLETVKSSYWNLTIWDSSLEYVEGWFNTQDGSHYRSPQDDNPNAISSAGINLQDWDPPSPGTYYIMIMPIAGDPVNNMRGPPLADQYYRLYLGLPNFGPEIKTAISDATIDEDEAFSGLDLVDYFQDPEGDPLTFAVRDDSNSVATTLSGSNVSATPIPDWSGECNITVEATDGGANIGDNTVEQTFTLTVNPINDDPFVKPGMALANFTMYEGEVDKQTFPKTLDEVFGDIDSELTYTFSGNSKIKVRIDQETTEVFFSTNPLEYWYGTENITFTAKDQGTNVAKVTVKVTVKHKNHGPTLGYGGKATYDVDMDEDDEGDFSLNVKNMFEDIDTTYAGDSLTYRLKDPLPLHLNLTIMEDYTLAIVPEANWSGDSEFKVLCEDELGVQNETTIYVTVEPVNDKPVILAFTPTEMDLTIDEGDTQLFMISSVNDIDNEYYDIRYNWYVNNELQEDENVQLKQFTFRTVHLEEDGFADGIYHIKCTVTDGELEDEVEWTIEVLDINLPPEGARIVTPTTEAPYKEGKPIVFEADMNASDPDGDPLYYKWVEKDSNVTLSEERTFTFDWKDKELKKSMKPGKHTIELYISDGRGEEIKTSITITIKKKEQQQQPGFEGVLLLCAVLVVVAVLGRRRTKR
jgi:hypothetical protein